MLHACMRLQVASLRAWAARYDVHLPWLWRISAWALTTSSAAPSAGSEPVVPASAQQYASLDRELLLWLSCRCCVAGCALPCGWRRMQQPRPSAGAMAVHDKAYCQGAFSTMVLLLGRVCERVALLWSWPAPPPPGGQALALSMSCRQPCCCHEWCAS